MEDMRIDEIHISITCGWFRAIKNIPEDWNADVVRPISERAQLHLSAGHGASDFANFGQLDGMIVVENSDDACFDISVSIITETSQISINKKSLRLIKIDDN